ncbi:hypothetical protein BLA29_008631 [Euroglyphus maynei]
METSS